MRAYRLKRPNDTWTPPIFSDPELDLAVHRRMSRLEGPVRLGEDGGALGPKLTRGSGTERLLDKSHGADVGHWYRLVNAEKKGVWVRVVNVRPTPADTTGSPGVDRLVGFLDTQFKGEWESWGLYVYKHIAGSSTMSDHSYVRKGYWCGRALDVHPYSVAIGDRIHAATTAEPSIMELLRYVLWRGVPNHYPGHLHFSFNDNGAPGYCS